MVEHNTSPQVFICHAGEDKQRFVLAFAKKLRAQGIDAWVDTWEIAPGDNLVDKIFEEGIKNAHAFIVVLSRHSVQKRWVREELNAAMIKKITSNTKLIPVVIEDCQVPECLQSTAWKRITDLNEYQKELDQIVQSIYGQREKPPLGTPPRYAKSRTEMFPELTALDSQLFVLACQLASATGHPYVDTDKLMNEAATLDIAKPRVLESLDVMGSLGYIEASKASGGNIPHFTITHHGLEQYFRHHMPEYETFMEAVALRILNHDEKDNRTLAHSLDESLLIITHILKMLEAEQLLTLSATPRTVRITKVSARLSRWLNQLQAARRKVLNPGSFLAVPIMVMVNEPLVIQFDASIPVSLYLLDPDQGKTFEESRHIFSAKNGVENQREVRFTFKSTCSGVWHFIIKNPSENEVAEITFLGTSVALQPHEA